MEAALPLLFAGVVGFGHAFEADHLVAVGNIVTKRNRLKLAMKDGVYWGLGHTSTIFLIGSIMIIGKSTFLNGYFGYLEALVGFMLVFLGCFRLYEYSKERASSKYFDVKNDFNLEEQKKGDSKHHAAYGIGLVHGIAGSGAMILLVMTEIQSAFNSMLYLVIFGIGSVIGMMVAAGIFSLPFSKRISDNSIVYFSLVLLSSFICIGFGIYMIIENLYFK